ncbi:hypothetical protein HDU97_009233 [Phlyctochytrium planicorne]|nr:hypothetical protein HDU97_009233 [Phlyctochytrium planicorne]
MTEKWAAQRLASMMQLPEDDAKQMVAYMMTLPKAEVMDYLMGFLGDSNDAIDFATQFISKRFPSDQAKASPGRGKNQSQSKSQSPGQSPKQWKDDRRVQPKKGEMEDFISLGKKKPAPKPTPDPTVQSNAPMAAENNVEDAVDKEKRKALKRERQVAKKAAATVSAEAIDGNVKVGKVVGLNGRLYCECLAAKHGLLTNCLTCGKIVCNLEGPGPCPSCGTLVESALQQLDIIQAFNRSTRVKEVMKGLSPPKTKDSYTGSRYGQKAGAQPPSAARALGTPGKIATDSYPELLSERDREALEKAQQQKERLLEYQRNSAVRTRVHDTASDFDVGSDASNIWLTSEERAVALKQAQESRKKDEEQKKRRIITLDLGKKKVYSVDASEYVPPPIEKKVIPDFFPSDTTSSSAQEKANLEPVEAGSTGLFRNPHLHFVPKFVAVDLEKVDAESASSAQLTLKMKRAAAATAAAQAQMCTVDPKDAKQKEESDDGLNSRARRAAKREGKSRPQAKVERVQDLLLPEPATE